MRLPHINPQHIMTFYFVAKETSFSLASEKLCITQSAVTQQIRALELQFKVKLINVKRKRAYLTKAGVHLMGLAEQFLNQTITIEDYLKSYTLKNLNVGIASELDPLPYRDHRKVQGGLSLRSSNCARGVFLHNRRRVA